MIALVGVLSPTGSHTGTVTMNRLPNPEHSRHAGYVVHCRDSAEVERTLAWHEDVRVLRRSTPLGLVCDLHHCAVAVGSLAYPVQPIIPPAELSAGALPDHALDQIRTRSVEGLIFATLCHLYGDELTANRETIEAIISSAVHGGTLGRVATLLGISTETIRRRLRAIGISPGRLRTSIRLQAYRLLVDLGEHPAAALQACGWSDYEARRKCQRRWQRSQPNGITL